MPAKQQRSQRVSDSEKFNDLMNGTEQNIGDNDVNRALGGGAYDAKDIFNILYDKHIESGIKTRVDAITIVSGPPYKAKYVRERNDLGFKKWAEKYEY